MAGVNWRGLARRDISLCCFSMMVFCGGRSLSICDSNLNLERTSHQNMANPIFPVQLFQVESEKAPNFLGMVNQILLSLFSMKFIVSYSEGVFSIRFQLLSKIFPASNRTLDRRRKMPKPHASGTVHDDTSDSVRKKH